MTIQEMIGKTLRYQSGSRAFTTSTVRCVTETNQGLLLDLVDGTTLHESEAYFVIDSTPRV